MIASESSRAQLEALVESVKSLATRRAATLCAVTISAKLGVSLEWLQQELAQELRRAGFGPVEVSVVRRGLELRLLSAEFQQAIKGDV
jgi:hypothetical protein